MSHRGERMFEEERLELLSIPPLKIDRPSLWPPIQDRAGLGLESVKTAFPVKIPLTQNSTTHHDVLQVV
jgi:hypothetical protein